MLEVSLLGEGTVLRLERDAWSMVKWLRQATDEYPPPSRGSYIATPLLSLEGATPESQIITSTMSSICKKVRPTSGS